MSDDLSGFSLMELFRLEAETQLSVLSSGLVALETDRSQAQAEALMRAAHSLKGAARICGLNTAVSLAHEMESVLVASMDGTAQLTALHIDWLLEGVDWLGQISRQTEDAVEAFQQSIQPAADALIGRLGSILNAPPAPVPPATPAPIEIAPVPSPEPNAVSDEGPGPATPPALTKPHPPATATEPADTTVRISGANLQRLMELAAESILESRHLTPFGNSLRQLQQNHEGLRRLLNAFPAGREHPGTVPPTAWLAEIRDQLTRTESVLATQREEFDRILRRSTTLADRLHHGLVASRMRPLSEGIQGFPRLVRDTARVLNKRARFTVIGEGTLVDRDLLEKLEAPLGHMLRNSIDHGLESPEERVARGKPEEGRIRLEARHAGGMLCLVVSDDGRGIEAPRLRTQVVKKGMCTEDVAARLSEDELLTFLFLPGFSTAEKVTEISGRGVGLDVVQTMVQEVGGTLRVTTEAGRGTAFHLQLPITRSVIRALLLEIAGEIFALPLARIHRALQAPRESLRHIEGRPFVLLDQQNVGLVGGAELLGLPAPSRETSAAELTAVILRDAHQTYGIEVDRFVGECELVVRPLDSRLGKIPDVSAVALLEDHSPVLILDVDDLLRSIESHLHRGALRPLPTAALPREAHAPRRILIAEDSLTVRELERKLLTQAGYEVHVAVDGMDAWNVLLSTAVDLLITDVDMPRLTGLQLVTRVRQSPRHARLPVIIMSYKDREEDQMRGLEAGANLYLTKSSFRDQTFVQTVTELLEHHTP